MRELVFALEYRPGCNEVADTLAEHPDARIRSLSLHATSERLWRVDHVTGPSVALEAVANAFLTADYYADCLATEDCGATTRTEILEQDDETLVLYSYWERTDVCDSVPHIALEHLGDGVLFETRNDGRRYTWRIVHSGDGDESAFFGALERAVGDCAGMEMRRSTDVSASSEAASDEDGLPPEQLAALRAAVEHGYYETPRDVDVGELAERLDVPRSTLAYRLRRAEAHLATGYVDQGPSVESTPESL
ncbi:MAG: putative DNA binding protein [Halobacteriales archaeon]|jgi:predicted DNA binding protein